MADPDESGAEGIIARKMVFCPLLQEFDTDELIVTCEECKDFFVCCCSCIQHDRERPGKPCHHFRLVFTDGACSHNGQDAATSGIGIACGENEESQLTIPLTNSIDKGHKRTSQRAELWAALFGVICMTHVDQTDSSKAEKAVKKRKNHGPRDSAKALVVATDSEYVVKGMTEWLPPWKDNNFRTNRNTKPANLDLFLKLDTLITAEEAKQDLKIGFWHIPRGCNQIADRLAKKAAQSGDPA